MSVGGVFLFGTFCFVGSFACFLVMCFWFGSLFKLRESMSKDFPFPSLPFGHSKHCVVSAVICGHGCCFCNSSLLWHPNQPSHFPASKARSTRSKLGAAKPLPTPLAALAAVGL